MTVLLASALEAQIERSLRRCRSRTRTLLAADRLGFAYARRLAEEASAPESRLEAIMHGDGELFCEELGLVRLGLVREEQHLGVLHYAITELGRRTAANVRARRAQGDRTAPRD